MCVDGQSTMNPRLEPHPSLHLELEPELESPESHADTLEQELEEHYASLGNHLMQTSLIA